MTIDDDAALKLRRAWDVLAVLREQVSQYQARSPYAVVPRRSSDGEWTEHVLQVLEPVPRSLSPLIGDVLHNLRSALETALFASLGGAEVLTTEVEQAGVAFPICGTRDEFDRKLGESRRARWAAPVREALLDLQPFTSYAYLDEESQARLSAEEWRNLDPIWRLFHLNNRDKHRRLSVLLWWPKLVWFVDREGQQAVDFQFVSRTPHDGAVLWRTRERLPGETELFQEFGIALADDLLHPLSVPTDLKSECVPTLEAFARQVEWAACRLAQAADAQSHDA